jgi:putative transposase
MCELAGVSRASFYRHWTKLEPAAAETELRSAVQRLALTYGYRRIAVLLQREGYVAGAKTVRRLMREDSLLAIRRRRFVVTTNSDHRFRVWPNLAQYLELTDINQLWVADLTFLRLEEEFAYLGCCPGRIFAPGDWLGSGQGDNRRFDRRTQCARRGMRQPLSRT